ncbi:sulfotransferase family 2 domain-containing protein [Nocardioides sp. LHG3406-4]|uniref:sulfotransferase family 2 domain-containing protein n=1 Tax=Nocardioides sp. LHG3406-4 TaxID=2804575 RepID=UPI003CE85B96
MLVSDAHRFLFVHVQKTGGVTIDGLLRPQLPDARSLDGMTRHARLEQILTAEPGLGDYWIAGVVRNPWARLLSWWSMVERFRDLAEQGAPKAQAFLSGKGFLAVVAREYADFESFVLRGTHERPRLQTPQVAYLTTQARRADFIGRQETFDADVATIVARLGLPPVPQVPRVNASAPRDHRDAYTPHMRDRVAEVFAADVEAFGYSF